MHRSSVGLHRSSVGLHTGAGWSCTGAAWGCTGAGWSCTGMLLTYLSTVNTANGTAVGDGGPRCGKHGLPVQNYQLGSRKARLCPGCVWSYPKMATGGYSALNTALYHRGALPTGRAKDSDPRNTKRQLRMQRGRYKPENRPLSTEFQVCVSNLRGNTKVGLMPDQGALRTSCS